MHGDKTRYNIALASAEASHCQDLLSQAQYYVTRARRIHDEEKTAREKQAEGLAAFNKYKEEERVRHLEDEKKKKEQELTLRHEYLEKSKNALLSMEMASEPKRKGGGRGRRDEYVSSDGSDGPRDANAERPKKRSKKDSAGRKRKEKRSKHDDNDSDSDGPSHEKRGRKKKDKTPKRPKESKGLTSKQTNRIVSKATISTSESDSDGGNKLKINSGGESDRSRSSRSSRSGSGRYGNNNFIYLPNNV